MYRKQNLIKMLKKLEINIFRLLLKKPIIRSKNKKVKKLLPKYNIITNNFLIIYQKYNKK